MSLSADLAWLQPFLAKLRCPNTHEALHVASANEKQRFAVAGDIAGLVNQSGTHLYPVVLGIPHLLPTSAIVAH